MEDLLGGEDSAGKLASLENREVDDASEVLQAHENLVEAEPDNADKFEDVIASLKKQVEEESGT